MSELHVRQLGRSNPHGPRCGADEPHARVWQARLRMGGTFLLLQVLRPQGPIASLLGAHPKLQVTPHSVRLAPDGESLLLSDLSSQLEARGAYRAHRERSRAADSADSTPEPTRLPLSSLQRVCLGAPVWCSRAAVFDMVPSRVGRTRWEWRGLRWASMGPRRAPMSLDEPGLRSYEPRWAWDEIL